MRVHDEVGRLAAGLAGDVLLLDGPPLEPATRVLRAWVGGKEVRCIPLTIASASFLFDSCRSAMRSSMLFCETKR